MIVLQGQHDHNEEVMPDDKRIFVMPSPEFDLYQLTEPFHFAIRGKHFTIPRGFMADGASIPAILQPWSYTPFHPKVLRAAFGHDFQYRGHLVDRKVADIKFREMCLEDGVPEVVAQKMYKVVRKFGEAAWIDSPRKPLIGGFEN